MKPKIVVWIVYYKPVHLKVCVIIMCIDNIKFKSLVMTVVKYSGDNWHIPWLD